MGIGVANMYTSYTQGSPWATVYLSNSRMNAALILALALCSWGCYRQSYPALVR
jgi:hypothetical protein